MPVRPFIEYRPLPPMIPISAKLLSLGRNEKC
jgi:hypothetical protein